MKSILVELMLYGKSSRERLMLLLSSWRLPRVGNITKAMTNTKTNSILLNTVYSTIQYMILMVPNTGLPIQSSAYERVLPVLPGRYLGVGLKMASELILLSSGRSSYRPQRDRCHAPSTQRRSFNNDSAKYVSLS